MKNRHVQVGEWGATGEGRIQAGALPGGAAIATWHLEAHDILGEAYGRLAAWLEENEREAVGPSWGGGYSWIGASLGPDPSSWPAPTEWRTELVHRSPEWEEARRGRRCEQGRDRGRR